MKKYIIALLTFLILPNLHAENVFEKNFQQQGDKNLKSLNANAKTEIYRGWDKDKDNIMMLEEGYDLMGFSSFAGTYVPPAEALVFGEKIKADTVLVYDRQINEATRATAIKRARENIKKKINLAKPEAEVTTPSTAAINALKKMNVKKIAIFTPYSKVLNDEVIDYFKSENFEVSSNAYFDILSDLDIGKVDEDYLYETLSKMDLGDADALFISCTALPALSIIDKLEKKLNKVVLSSNQVLIWDTLQSIGKKNSIEGFGKLFKN